MAATAELGQPDRTASPRRLIRRPNPVLLAGLALIAASLGLRLPILSAAYFVEDDLLFVGDAYEHELTFDFLFRIHKGHLMPGALTLTWVESRIAAYHWPLVAGVTLATQALAAVLLLRLLRSLFGDRWVILIPLAVYAFTPLTLPPFSWWSAALNGVPLQLALAGALAAQVRYARGEATGRAGIWWAVFGMAFSTKGVFIPFVLFAVTTAFLRPEWRRIGWVRAMLAEARGHPRLWGGHALLIAGYAALYLFRLPSAQGEGASVPRPDVSAELVGGLLGRTFPAGIVGGPLRWAAGPPTGGMSDPPAALVAGAWAALAALVLATLWWRRRAARAWLIVALYLVFADAAPTVVARGASFGTLGAEARYVADAAVVFAVCLALALTGLRDEAEPYRRTPPRAPLRAGAAVLAIGAFLTMSVVSAEGFRDTLQGDRQRSYLDAVRRSLAAAPADTVIFSRAVPDWLVLPWNGERRLSHRVLAPLADPALRARMRVPPPSEAAKVFDDAGRLVPAAVDAGFARVPPPGEWCLSTIDGAVYWPEPRFVARPDMVAGLAYSAARATSVTFEVAGRVQQVELRPTRDGLVHFPIPATGKGLLMRVDDPSAGVCLRGFAYGAAIPQPPPQAGREPGGPDGRGGEPAPRRTDG
ncbi:hypothetical protein AB0K60_04285 [Thermopolyspora sp. NPDC052614]|uniref:hypothetical protein n=1 Tax=Thermopolyspora sp. NPDC052614 TaxID=3155682 RepID=UPI00342A6111